MKISEIFKQKKAVLSFEIFPPKAQEGSLESIYSTIERLGALNPDFISVTYGAGGSGSAASAQIASAAKNRFGLETLAHLTCVNSSEEDTDRAVERLAADGVGNILALRGDSPDGSVPQNHASDLIRHIKAKYGGVGLSAACYPEGHPQSPDLASDAAYIRLKEEAGAEHFISQLFFDNDIFYEYMYRLRESGVTAPVQAGIMPVVNKKSVTRLVQLCGASFPKKFVKIVDKYGEDPRALFDAGCAYATEQIIDLLTSGAPGIHLYTMNRPDVAERVAGSVRGIIDSLNGKCQTNTQ
ncbi:MAG: methylenetetrahydrofolate reductase [Clostridiales bacterium]|jgi:methylenetetrahydrofolate reductase (NADPH)|nr:methylenetetrahydrofolate reductase [Clostridiales bacterium]